MKTKNCYGIDDFENCLKIAELQREMSVRLHILNESQKRKVEELKYILSVAQQIADLKQKVGKELITLNEEDRKQANKLLMARHLKI